jgi:site-specific recombinase XerC
MARLTLSRPRRPESPKNLFREIGLKDCHDTRALQAYLGHESIQHMVRYTELSIQKVLAHV